MLPPCNPHPRLRVPFRALAELAEGIRGLSEAGYLVADIQVHLEALAQVLSESYAGATIHVEVTGQDLGCGGDVREQVRQAAGLPVPSRWGDGPAVAGRLRTAAPRC